jgi:hypothetical protein
MRQQEDWYAYLNLTADTPTERVEQAVERLSRQAAALAVTAPERSQRLRDTVRAIKRDLLSGPENRARYDAGLAVAAASDLQPPPPPPPPPPPYAAPPYGAPQPPAGGERISSRISRFLRTGWTCSSCGKEALPSDKFCTRCGTIITPTRRAAAAPAARPYCGKCAAPLGVNDAFCSRCGTPVGN